MTKKSNNYIEFLLGIFLITVIISIIVLSLVPPTSRDELTHHLAVPKLYLEHRGIYEIPFMEYSYYPMNLDLLYMIPLYFGNDIVPKFIHFCFALLTAWLIFFYLKRRTNSLYALYGAVLFLSIPVVIKLSTAAYIDLGEIFFTFAGLVLVIEWVNSYFRLKYLILAALMCGLALGTKYNGLITLTILTFFIPFLYSRYYNDRKSGSGRPIFFACIFFIVSLLVFSPWMIRNYYWKGNPVYPLYEQIFNKAEEIRDNGTDEDNATTQNLGFFTYRSLIYKETGLQIAMLPLRIFYQGKDNDPQYFDGRLNPFLLLLPFFAFYRSRNDPETLKREKKILLAFLVLFFFFALFSTVLRMRYIAPIIPPLIVLSIFGLINLFGIVRQIPMLFLRKTCIALLIIIPCGTLALNTGYLISLFRAVDPVPVITGSVTRDEYIEKYIPEYPAVRFINGNLDANVKVLLIYTGNRGYYCERDYIFDNDMGKMKQLFNRAQRHEKILEGFKKQGVTHMLINYRLFNKWIDGNFSGERRQDVIKDFLRFDLSLLFEKNGFVVLVLK
jgi:hypothetical protein